MTKPFWRKSNNIHVLFAIFMKIDSSRSRQLTLLVLQVCFSTFQELEMYCGAVCLRLEVEHWWGVFFPINFRSVFKTGCESQYRTWKLCQRCTDRRAEIIERGLLFMLSFWEKRGKLVVKTCLLSGQNFFDHTRFFKVDFFLLFTLLFQVVGIS